VGFYAEDIPLPYGVEEAAKRIGAWLESERGKNFRVREKGDNHVRLQGTWGPVLLGEDVWFDLRMSTDGVHAECWVSNLLNRKLSIAPALLGKYPREKAWADYVSLKTCLLAGTGIEVQSMPPSEQVTVAYHVACPYCGAKYPLRADLIRDDRTIQCQNCLMVFPLQTPMQK
jgi:DNA-directed RNA polymerase subunit RPC12/RpoP